MMAAAEGIPALVPEDHDGLDGAASSRPADAILVSALASASCFRYAERAKWRSGGALGTVILGSRIR